MGRRSTSIAGAKATENLLGRSTVAASGPPSATGQVDADSRVRSTHVPWLDSKQPPLLVQLTCEQETLSVPVFDERPSRDRENTIPPEVDEDLAQTMRDELLFEAVRRPYVAADANRRRRSHWLLKMVTRAGGSMRPMPDSYDRSQPSFSRDGTSALSITGPIR